MDPNFGFTAEEASTMVPSPPRSTEPPTTATQPSPMVTSSPETPTITPQVAPQRSMASVIRVTTSQPSSERQRIFSKMSQDEKNKFLFSHLEAAADRIQRQTDFIRITKNDQVAQQVEINKLKSTVEQQQTVIGRQQAEIDQLKAENARLKTADEAREQSISILQKLAEDLKGRCDFMKEWYDSRNTTIVDGVKRINAGYEFLRKRVATLWEDRCKQQEVLKKHDHDSKDQGNPDSSADAQQPPASTSAEIVAYKPPQVESSQGTSSGA
ncbi:hypothetical protein HanHA300_Chr13g0492531 [Helianthus annuus]|nr:hypothetical protein HanHA300_Chr13g0492531 [Helianthus annuus]KAJ0482362.1 hypothetical protein HanIR_Chr13g0653041 [Helianthus annuus]KAJ0850239.1 hypothetical protein HanPSC8_Chr13g0578301 [Helianthus annuus]